ncbi:MAG: efflux RND transporter periplasmic adaptor subunit [Desulfobacterales bacterium]|jgi:RND family efflux transporter MFP subunit
MDEQITTADETTRTGRSLSRRRLLLNIGLSLAVIVAGIIGAAYITKTAPKARRRPPAKIAPLVEVAQIQPGIHNVAVQAMGTVVPAKEIVLESRVSGEIVALHPQFAVGGFLEKGSEVLRIEPLDYELAVTLAEARVKDSESILKVAEEEAAAAVEEWRLLYSNKPENAEIPALVAKEPQLEAARAKLAAEKADLQKAKLDLARTRIKAPFNAIVRKKFVDIGSQVSGQEQLAELIGTDVYWIQASIPVDRLNWITIPRQSTETGSKVRIFHRNEYIHSGTVIKLLGDLEQEGRMARVIIEVRDPLGLRRKEKKQLPLLIGEYVRLEISGRQLDNVYRIPRTALRDSNRIWVASSEDTLKIRDVDILWRDSDTVLFRDGLQPGDRLIVSELPTPVDGMAVQIAR